MAEIKLRGVFPLGNTLGTALQLAPSLDRPVATEVDGTPVQVDLTTPAGSSWPQTFEVQVELKSLDELAQREGFEVMKSAARRVSDLLRVTQPTTGMPGTWPATNVVTLLVDGKTRPLAFDWYANYRPSATMFYPEGVQPGRPEGLRALRAEQNVDWDLDIYVGQALHMSRFNSDTNPSLAVFLAALVCEVKIKRELHRRTPAELREELLSVVPEFKQARASVPELYSSVAVKFLGRSLKKERKLLFSQLVDVFEKRNAFTHRAEELSLEEATRAAVVARRVAAWVDGGAPPNYQR